MQYKCYLCEYETDTKSQIHTHHIIPKESGGANKDYNLINLCPSCHSRIYIPAAVKGIHSKKGMKSVILKGWCMTSQGKKLEYIDENNRNIIK